MCIPSYLHPINDLCLNRVRTVSLLQCTFKKRNYRYLLFKSFINFGDEFL